LTAIYDFAGEWAKKNQEYLLSLVLDLRILNAISFRDVIKFR